MHKSDVEIITLLESPEARKRGLGLTLVGKMLCYAALEHTMAALHEEDVELRERAAWALDQLCSPVSVPALIEALNDPVFGVRSNAGWALVHLAQRTIANVVVPDVIDVLAGSQNEDARQMAFLVLHHIGGEEATDAIRRYWKQ
jgi:hypothetical protein